MKTCIFINIFGCLNISYMMKDPAQVYHIIVFEKIGKYFVKIGKYFETRPEVYSCAWFSTLPFSGSVILDVAKILPLFCKKMVLQMGSS